MSSSKYKMVRNNHIFSIKIFAIKNIFKINIHITFLLIATPCMYTKQPQG